MSVSPELPRPIFVQGILARSGTNFLNELLVIHPDCGSPSLHEDYLLSHAHWLQRYVTAVTGNWDPAWGRSEADTYAALGRGLLELLRHNVTRPRVVTKTPNVHNLALFFKLLPNAQLLLLVRDGRDVVESGVNSFSHWTYEQAIHWWASAARTIVEFEAARRGTVSQHRLVRYEQLIGDMEGEVERILRFLELEVARYDFEQARRLPVRGSSAFRGDNHDVQWQATVEKTAAFKPVERWRTWPLARHARFNWVAGPYMRQLGYELAPVSGAPGYWSLWNRVMDQRWQWQARRRRTG